MIIGYARVSTADQNPERQTEALKLAGAQKIFIDHASGKDSNRPSFSEMMEFVREGDELVVISFDRLSRNLRDLLNTIDTLKKKCVTVHFIKGDYRFLASQNDPMQNMMLGIMGAVAEFERDLIKERQAEGIAIAKSKGTYKGRAPIAKDKVEQILERHKLGIPVTRIAKDLKIGLATCHRYIKLYKCGEIQNE